MTPCREKSVCYPIVIVNANRSQCRTVVDTGAGSSYLSSLDGRFGRLFNLFFKLQCDPALLKEYDDKIQLAEGIVEKAPATKTFKEFNIPHTPEVKQSAETTDLRIVNDASAK